MFWFKQAKQTKLMIEITYYFEKILRHMVLVLIIPGNKNHLKWLQQWLQLFQHTTD